MSLPPARSPLEPAIVPGDDPREFAAVLHAVYDAARSGDRLPARPRSVIGESWERAATAGVDPEHGSVDEPLGASDVEQRRTESGLADVLESITGNLDVLVSGSDNVLIVADASGHVLWRAGGSHVLRRADHLGFTEGASWAERNVGTNAIGTALASRQAVQVFSAEHFVRTHHAWTCTGAPIRDPRTGDVLGVVDVSGPAPSIHPATLALVDSVARLTEAQLRDAHRIRLDLLRSVAAPILARSGSPAVAVDPHGWVAAVDRVSPRTRVSLPRDFSAGRSYIGDLGPCDVEPLPGGWLLRVTRPDETAVTTHVDLVEAADGTAVVQVDSASGSWVLRPSPRHFQILGLLAANPAGLTAAELSAHLFGSADRTVTVRAEMSRLRRRLGGLMAASPYRFADGVSVGVPPAAA
ncbi:helix-turn-helix domain-containing protein [Gordonia neofelifaecis]|uniref:GAF domain-containing protein n=1 Tax=Gordonia neofelifaecis NRRL B-59395 TaxID=644548 RepID=F1YKI0_9ACTN|nr:helix-turn-helix domain-containing protein [Gordonia neofelifaecis]EGD54866.1 GAF domain-containing protein [Gordonia neofelifaecis NRRL B-59395]